MLKKGPAGSVAMTMQWEELHRYGVPVRRIYSDVAPGTVAPADRPAMTKLLDQVEEGEVVVAWAVDRIGRVRDDVVAVADLLESRGVHIVTIIDQVDTRETGGRDRLEVLAGAAEADLVMTRARIQAGIDVLKRHGIPLGRPPLDPLIVETQAKVIRRMLDDGGSVTQVSQALKISRATVYRRLAATKPGA